MFRLARPLLFSLPPEYAHELTLQSLELGVYHFVPKSDDPCLKSQVWGLEFPNPIGVAAGFDKNARVMRGVLGLGCGFAEIGTVTPRAQAGNPQPRVFRLVEDRAVINRLGFNNDGHAVAARRLKAWVDSEQRRNEQPGIVGVNIGANKDQTDRVADYVTGLRAFYSLAAYFTVNISSPNTPGLRDLQAPQMLDDLLGRIMDVRAELVRAGGIKRPIIVKVSPDVAEADIGPIADRLIAHKVDGLAVSNTTLARPALSSAFGAEVGGLSGAPLFHRSTVMLARFYCACEGRIPIIGIGGVSCGETALAKLKAGASLVQLYTALIYQGPGLVNKIKQHLIETCRANGLESIDALVGQDAEAWATKELE